MQVALRVKYLSNPYTEKHANNRIKHVFFLRNYTCISRPLIPTNEGTYFK